jgi:hypothetical protein
LIDEVYESVDDIVDGLPVDSSEEVLDRYGFSSATEFLNFVEDNLVIGEADFSRVLRQFENLKCPYCEEFEPDSEDPTLETSDGSVYESPSYRPDVDEVVVDYFSIFCDTHLDAWIEKRDISEK